MQNQILLYKSAVIGNLIYDPYHMFRPPSSYEIDAIYMSVSFSNTTFEPTAMCVRKLMTAAVSALFFFFCKIAIRKICSGCNIRFLFDFVFHINQMEMWSCNMENRECWKQQIYIGLSS